MRVIKNKKNHHDFDESKAKGDEIYGEKTFHVIIIIQQLTREKNLDDKYDSLILY